ncbi:hypothetical protein MRX96_034229 [Rhipicephalus microplus]
MQAMGFEIGRLHLNKIAVLSLFPPRIQDVVERFPMSLISDPTAFTLDDPRELYNILVFVVQDDPTSSSQQEHAEMHIFQCVRISAKKVVDDIKAFIMAKSRGRLMILQVSHPYECRTFPVQ